MMYVHGGGFRTGSGAIFNGTELAKRGVVVVAINYRLDILGSKLIVLRLSDTKCNFSFYILSNQVCN